MPRYIDADAMIRKICGMKCGCERYECGYDEAGCPKVRDLETAPTVSPDEVRGVGMWISVEERLPKKDEMVIVYYSWTGQSGTEYKEVSIATLDEMRYCGNKLLGWMPLPEPPKEVQDG